MLLCFLLIPQNSNASPKTKGDEADNTIFDNCLYSSLTSSIRIQAYSHTLVSIRQFWVQNTDEIRHLTQISWCVSKCTTLNTQCSSYNSTIAKGGQFWFYLYLYLLYLYLYLSISIYILYIYIHTQKSSFGYISAIPNWHQHRDF